MGIKHITPPPTYFPFRFGHEASYGDNFVEDNLDCNHVVDEPCDSRAEVAHKDHAVRMAVAGAARGEALGAFVDHNIHGNTQIGHVGHVVDAPLEPGQVEVAYPRAELTYPPVS